MIEPTKAGYYKVTVSDPKNGLQTSYKYYDEITGFDLSIMYKIESIDYESYCSEIPVQPTGLTPQQEKEFTDIYTGLIRYGYQEAIDEINKFILAGENDTISEYSVSIIQEFLVSMMATKRQIDFNKIKSELEAI